MSPAKKQATPKKCGGGRPEAKFDLKQVEKLASYNCTVEEIASFFEVDRRTIFRHCKEDTFNEAIERGRAAGRRTLRQLQMEGAMAGNATMLIWLGKQLLGQRDFAQVQMVGAGKNGEIEVNVNSARDELASKLAVIAARAATPENPERAN